MLLCSRQYANKHRDRNSENHGIGPKPRYADDTVFTEHISTILPILVALMAESAELGELTQVLTAELE